SVLLSNSQMLIREPVQDAKSGQKNLVLATIHRADKPALNGRRVILFPAQELLIMIPEGDDRLLLRKLALREALGRLAVPVVVSPTDLSASRGQTFNHELRAFSNARPVTFSVVKGSAPGSMTVSQDGKVSWPVPPKYTGTAIAVIKAKDAKGQEVPHRLN